MKYTCLIKAMILILASPLLAQAHLVTGTVTGPDGLVPGVIVQIHLYESGWMEITTDGSGHFSVDVPNESMNFIGPRFPEESDLIGEQVWNINISGGREVHLFAAEKFTITGEIQVPGEYTGELDYQLNRLDKQTFLFDWSVDESRQFQATVPAGVYVITAQAACRHSDILNQNICPLNEYFSSVSVDVSEGDVSNVVVPVQDPLAPLIPKTPPDASLISVGPADDGGIAMITGAPGATTVPALITIVNLQTGHYTNGASRADGSFEIPFLAPPGSFLEVRQDPTRLSGGNSLAAGTIIRVPPPGDPASSFATLNRAFQWSDSIDTPKPVENVGIHDSGQVWITGDIPDREWQPGETVELNGSLKVYSKNAASIDISSLYPWGNVFLERVFDESGKQERANPVFMSSLLTPTGMPIERRGQNCCLGTTYAVRVGEIEITGLSLSSPLSLDANWQSILEIPGDLPEGVYSLVFEPFVGDITNPTLHFDGVYPQIFDTIFSRGGATMVKIGSPGPGRLSWVLGLNDFSNGSRGTVALEDRDRIGIAGRVTTNASKFILPRENAGTGFPVTYRLEPFVPLIGASNRGWVTPPTIPFNYPSGNMHVSIRQPDNSIVDLGSAPFSQSYVQEPASISGHGTDAGNHPLQYFGLSTRDPKFDISFTQYGRHLITMTGTIDDARGASYPGGGTYEVFVARTLDLETGTFVHTPFEVGNAFAPTVIVQPGIEADIQIEISLYPESDPDQVVRHTINGKSNRFGYFHPKAGDAFVFSQPGEYRVDITASHTDEEGVLWMGTDTWASVVEMPDSPLITHGQRNHDCSNNTRQQWVVATESNICGTHLTFPYHTGDIAWMLDTDIDPFFTAMVPAISIQDTLGDFAELLRSRETPEIPYWFGDLEESIAIGQIPLLSTTSGNIPGPLKSTSPDTHLAYFYSGAARPGVRIRDMVSEAENQESYWRFEDYYYDQHGAGRNGDQTNDYKFQFGGTVYRASGLDFFYYGSYGSLWVLLPDDDPVGTRVMPPFQGNAGGPTGGPIMTLKGEEIEMFFHTTGTRAGSILEIGDFASFAGQIGPTLPSQVSITVTSPSEQVTQIDGQANKVGYFYDPSTDLRLTEAGVWTVNVNIWHDGQTSAGPTTMPYPTGNVLGSNAGVFHFYVVKSGSQPLVVDGPESVWVKPGRGPIVFNITAPPGWTDLELQRTTVIPGFIMEDVTTPTLTYSYDAPTLNTDFPNLDLEDHDGITGVDTITMSFMLSGMLDGQPVYRARQVLLQGEELMLPPQTRSESVFVSGFE